MVRIDLIRVNLDLGINSMVKHIPMPPLSAITGAIRRRFFLQFHRQKPSDCWLWLGRSDVSYPTGEHYGRFKMLGMLYQAHRVAYYLKHGNDPREYQVCHSCDITLCVNWNHLWLGTKGDNTHDSFQKGRSNHSGENHPQARLTNDLVKMIRESTLSNTELSKLLNVCPSNISHVRNFRTFK